MIEENSTEGVGVPTEPLLGEGERKVQVLRIFGMSCDHCARQIEQALKAVEGVASVRVAYPNGLAWVEVTASLPVARLLDVVTAKGYGAEPLEQPPKAARRGKDSLNIAVIGSGAAAFACAIRAAEAGAKVTLIEQGTLGGTCVNAGCVPSKILIQAAHLAHLARCNPFWGLKLALRRVDRAALLAQQQARVDELRYLKYQSILNANPNLELLIGQAFFKDAHTLEVTAADGSVRQLTPDRILIATGAIPVPPPIPGLKGTPFWTSTEALMAKTLPKHLIVLGGSAIGLELGQAFSRLGAQVTIIELFGLLPHQDPKLGESLKRHLEEEGLRVITHAQAKEVAYTRFRFKRGGRFTVDLGDKTVEGNHLLVATGRRPNTEGLQLKRAGVVTAANGAIVVDERLRTNVPHIYAAGDCTNLPQLVYVAAAAGSCAAVNMTGGEARLDLSIVPQVVFTDPQVASVGLTEQEAAQQGLSAESRTLTLDNVPRALANFDTRGFIQLVAERNTGRLLGAQVLAPNGGEVIQTAALAIRQRITVDELAGQLFPYLTMVEGLKLCAQTFRKDVRQLSCCAA
ncbi:MAG: mercury(II) reductase [Methylohalobius sp.]